MKEDFFFKEIRKAQQRFNQTFGMLTTCDIRLRQSVILIICKLGRLEEKILKARDKLSVRDDIRKFIRIRNTLNKVFITIENFQKERRNYGIHARTQP